MFEERRDSGVSHSSFLPLYKWITGQKFITPSEFRSAHSSNTRSLYLYFWVFCYFGLSSRYSRSVLSRVHVLTVKFRRHILTWFTWTEATTCLWYLVFTGRCSSAQSCAGPMCHLISTHPSKLYLNFIDGSTILWLSTRVASCCLFGWGPRHQGWPSGPTIPLLLRSYHATPAHWFSRAWCYTELGWNRGSTLGNSHLCARPYIKLGILLLLLGHMDLDLLRKLTSNATYLSWCDAWGEAEAWLSSQHWRLSRP